MPGLLRRPALAVAAPLLAGLTAGCGSVSGPAPDVAVADARLGGSYTVASMTVDEQSETPVVPVTFQIDADYGELVVDTGCNTLLGSFSLLGDGRAGVTLAGGSSLSCTDTAQQQESTLLATLAGVDSWSETAAGLALHAPGGDEIVLAR